MVASLYPMRARNRCEAIEFADRQGWL